MKQTCSYCQGKGIVGEKTSCEGVCNHCQGKGYIEQPDQINVNVQYPFPDSKPTAMWQVCPVCNGKGIDEVTPVTNGIYPCPVCKGKRIISIIDGKPPIN